MQTLARPVGFPEKIGYQIIKSIVASRLEQCLSNEHENRKKALPCFVRVIELKRQRFPRGCEFKSDREEDKTLNRTFLSLRFSFKFHQQR
jgi:hypothetical protein